MIISDRLRNQLFPEACPWGGPGGTGGPAFHKKRARPNMNKVTYTPIGIIHSPFREPRGTPIQPPGAKGIDGRIEIFPQYVEGLSDLDGFSHIILIYHFHLAKSPSLIMKPFMDDQPHGIFAIRAPSRPNPIGISVVRLVEIQKNILHVQDVDILDETPLLDIKPYAPDFDPPQVERKGWLEKNVRKVQNSRDDGRFAE
jgi:tRNA-Thr(GGU) m(6)t(6)A37 methyltransferase TsaA